MNEDRQALRILSNLNAVPRNFCVGLSYFHFYWNCYNYFFKEIILEKGKLKKQLITSTPS